MYAPYESLDESAKVWIYPSSRKFYKEELETLENKIKNFVNEWKSEDKDFQASYQFLYNRFIIILAEDECGELTNKHIDELVGFILKLQTEYEVELLDRMNVCFKQGEFVQYKEVKEFKKLLKNKSVSAKTVVFDNLIQTKEELENFWEVPITESWYNRFL
ncbi:ABC transporter ATPase [Pseudotenacibaculum sp. MALMAid0570]